MNKSKSSRSGAAPSGRGVPKSAARGAAGIAAVAAPRILHAENRRDAIRLAHVGVGTQGQVLLNNVLKCRPEQKVAPTAVCDIWHTNRDYAVRSLRKYYQCDVRGYVDLGEMLDAEKGKIDAAIIATPDWVHHEHAIMCMEAGLDVYCEKEMSNRIDNARRMVEASRKTGRLLQIGHQRRSNPRYRVLYEHVAVRKACGRLTNVSGNWNRDKPLTVNLPKGPADYLDPATLRRYGYEDMQHFRNWRWYRRYSGGPMADLGSHQVDVLNWVVGSVPSSVMASGGADNYPHMEWWDNIIAVYEWDVTDSGENHVVRGNYDLYSTTSHGGYQEVFMGTHGTAVISEDATKGGFRCELRSEKNDWEKRHATGPCEYVVGIGIGDSLSGARVPGRYYPPIPVPADPKTEHMPHLENFFRAIRGTEKLNCPAEVGFETAVCILKVDQAVQAQRKLTFDPAEFKA